LIPDKEPYCRKHDLYCKDANCPQKYALKRIENDL
jgi:hypothetical protein